MPQISGLDLTAEVLPSTKFAMDTAGGESERATAEQIADFVASHLGLHFGEGSPEGEVVAPVGHVYFRSDGGSGTTLYVKESGTGNTGWDAK